MKKLIILAFSFLCFQGFSQSFSPGIELGIAASQVSGDGYAGFNKNGPIAGVFVEKKIKKNFLYSVGMHYIIKGSRRNPNLENNDQVSYLLRLHYVEMPILLNYKYRKFKLFAGVSIGGLLHYNVFNEYGPYPEGSSERRPFKNYEIANNFGICYMIAQDIDISLNLAYSMLPIRNHLNNLVWYNNRGQYNEVLGLAIKYKIHNN